MCCGARAPHARAAYAKAAEIRSEPCSLTALRLNLQFSPGETPSFLCWRPEWLAGLQFCSATSRYSDGAPRGSRGKPFPPTPGVCWPVGGAGPRVHPINGGWGGRLWCQQWTGGSLVLSGRGEVGSTHSAQRSPQRSHGSFCSLNSM